MAGTSARTVFTDDDLRRIAAGASTLYERLLWPVVPAEVRSDREVIDRRLARWCETAAAGNWERFDRRLAADDLDRDRVRPYLGSSVPWPDLPLPEWAETLKQMVNGPHPAASRPPSPNAGRGYDDRQQLPLSQHWETPPSGGGRLGREARGLGGEGSEGGIDPADPVPFEEILAPYVSWASGQLARRVGDAYDLLEPRAHAEIEHALLRFLAFQSARPLQVEFAAFRAGRQTGWDLLLSRLQPGDGTDLYQAFVRELSGERLVRFLREHSAVARRLATLVDMWLATTAELIERLAADWADVAATFNHGHDLGRVDSLKIDQSDPHNGGRTVAFVEFTGGLRLVYKPKSLEAEVGLANLLAWLSERGFPLAFRRLAILSRPEYGWVEFVERAPCPDEAAVQRFFQRMGGIACVIYGLEGADFHSDNIIAAGEQPMLVDAEALFHPHLPCRLLGQTPANAPATAASRLNNSVLRTHILPHWTDNRDGHGIDLSGMGGMAGQAANLRQMTWARLNRDDMDLETQEAVFDGRANLPVLDGQVVNPDAYAADFLSGFQQMYRCVVHERDDLLAPGGPFQALAGLPGRLLLRPTRLYGRLLQLVTHPDSCRYGIDASIETDVLSRLYVPAEGEISTIEWPILAAEHAALAAIDIPIFTTRANDRALWFAPDRALADYFDEPSVDRAAARIRAFADEDLAWQSAVIQAAFAARISSSAEPSASSASRDDVDPDEVPPLTRDDLVAEALAIAAQLREVAIRAGNGDVAWIGPRPNSQGQQFQLDVLGNDLYGGAPGIALFLAALERLTGGAGYRELVIGTLAGLRRDLRAGAYAPVGALGLGGFTGAGALVYALLRADDLLDDGALVEDALAAATLIDTDRIAADRSLDLLAGSAGAILALLALYERTGEKALLARAVACGDHLLAQRRPGLTGCLAWPTTGGKLLAGFAHGAAGIAYALLRLAAATDDSRFRQAALEGIAHERGLFAADAGNWYCHTDTVPAPGEDFPGWMSSWCHGAAGIGLARVASLATADTPEIRDDIAIALNTLRQGHGNDVDHLCCGHAGRIDILLETGRRLDCTELIELANRRAAWLVQRAHAAGAYQLFPGLPAGVSHPALFRGTAGIGYTLLRLADDRQMIPTVLLLA